MGDCFPVPAISSLETAWEIAGDLRELDENSKLYDWTRTIKPSLETWGQRFRDRGYNVLNVVKCMNQIAMEFVRRSRKTMAKRDSLYRCVQGFKDAPNFGPDLLHTI